MSSTREQVPPCRKRQYAEADVSLHDPSEFQPSKRLKPSIKLHSAEFYDSLSKVWLTRRALKELDRRTRRTLRTVDLTWTPRRVTRNTSKQIQRFARHGGPELRDLRGYPEPTNLDLAQGMSSSRGSRRSSSGQSKSTAPTSNPTSRSSNRRSSAYDNDFEQHLIDHHIYPEGYDYSDGREDPEPDNFEKFHQRLAQPRPSLSPSRFTASDFKDFKQKNARVIDEGDVMRNVVPIMAGDSDIPSRQNLLFTRLDSITNSTTVNAKPDFYDGASLGDVDKTVREDIGDYIIPTGHTMAPVAPNFFLEVKRPSGGADVAKRQACYNGAIGARAMHQLQSYKQEPVYDGNTYTITTTYHAGNLRMYATHPTQAEDGTTEYHMSTVDGWDTFGNPNTCRQGFTALRNSRDYTNEIRNEFITAANERARAGNVVEPPSEYNDVSGPTDVQDTTYAQDTAYAPVEDPADDFHYCTSQQEFQGAYTTSEPSAFQASGYDDPIESQPSTLESSNYNGYSNIYPTQESETSADELSLDTYAQPKASNKRRSGTEKPVVKASRHTKNSRGKRRKN